MTTQPSSNQRDDWEAMRAAFVAIIKHENFMTHGSKQSLRASWAGPRAGFHDHMLDERYRHFCEGWKAAKKAAVEPDVLRDAERYRFLRRGNDYAQRGPMVVLCESQHIDSDDRPFWSLAESGLDAAIDGARGETRATVPPSERRTAWMIESRADGPTRYRCFGFDFPTWTLDVNRGLQFSRRQDADSFAGGDPDDVRVVEHVFVGATVTKGIAP